MKILYSDLDIRFSVEGTEFRALNIIYERLNRRIPDHSHGPGCFEIHCISEGYGRAVVDGTAYRLEPGTIYVTGPGVAHTQLPDQKNPMWEYCVYLRAEGEPGRGTVTETFLSTPFWFGRDSQDLLRLLEELFAEFRVQQTGYMMEIRLLLQQLLVKLVRCYELGKISPEHFPPSNRRDSSSVIVEEYFLYEYQSCSLETLSARLGLSARQTERLLKRQYGITFREKRTQARMAVASVLLLETAASVTDIALELGYSSAEHFTNAFRRVYGLSPRAYRAGAGGDGRSAVLRVGLAPTPD